MQRTKISTLVTVGKVIEKHNKNYCYASQNTLLNLLKTHQNIVIQRRMLNYHLADLRTAGVIKTQGRTHRNEDGTICLLSSATCLTIKGAYLLYKLGSSWALRHFKALKKRYAPRPAATAQDSRIPADHRSKKPTTYPSKNPFLDQECRRKMGLPELPSFLKTPA